MKREIMLKRAGRSATGRGVVSAGLSAQVTPGMEVRARARPCSRWVSVTDGDRQKCCHHSGGWKVRVKGGGRKGSGETGRGVRSHTGPVS